MSDQKLFVDAVGPAILFNGPIWIDCSTLQEAVMEWYSLPPERAQRASIRPTRAARTSVGTFARPRNAGSAFKPNIARVDRQLGTVQALADFAEPMKRRHR